jgi:histidinol dehydrogenase
MAKVSRIPLVEAESAAGKTLLRKIEAARTAHDRQVQQVVDEIVDAVRQSGDSALFGYTQKLDGVRLTAKRVRVDTGYIAERARKAPAKLKKTIREAAKRIRAYHNRQVPDTAFRMKTQEGTLEQLIRPIDSVGLYIPGGYTAYPSTVLMNVIPARIAGVKRIVAVTPPRAELDTAVAYVLHMLKVDEVYRIGGAQAIAALAYGTKSIRPVDKIVGPGGSFVATAKKRVFGQVDIDSVAGPSEVAVLADTTADPVHVALDLLSQAEHGTGDETAVCVTESATLAEKVRAAVIAEIAASPVKDVFAKLPSQAISIFVSTNRAASIELINRLAPEHLQIITRTARQDLKSIRNAAAIFLGPLTPVAFGDYFVGTNHVLPTGTGARYASPLGVESFLKRISVAQVTRRGLRDAGPHVARFAQAEGFVHHALSVERRLEPIPSI